MHMTLLTKIENGIDPKYYSKFQHNKSLDSFQVVKIFLDPKSLEKVNFVYTKDEESMKLMRKYLPEFLPVEFGGKSDAVYNHKEYSN
jgi:hypothetical protein